MYAVVEINGKQYKAEKGKTLKVDLLAAEPNSKIDIDKVLLVSNDASQTVSVGTPYVSGAKVSATVCSHGKDKKIVVFKYIPKKDYRRKNGHRQPFSLITIDNIAV